MRIWTLGVVLLCWLTNSVPSVIADDGDWDGKFYQWVWGPEATLTVESANATRKSEENEGTSLLEKALSLVKLPNIHSEAVVNVKPLWDKDSANFPPLGLNGVLIKAEPVYACSKLEPHPEYPTIVEELIEEIDQNTTHFVKTNWILLVNEGYCNITEKMINAERAGYAALLLLSSDPTSDEDLTEISQFKVYAGKIAINDGMTLIETYTYPEPVAVKLEDVRNLQWNNAIYKIIGMMIGAFLLLFSMSGLVLKLFKLQKKWKEEIEARELQETLRQTIETMPLTVWELNQMTKDEKCHICYGLFYPNDIVRTMPCFHRFHQRCIVTRFENGNTECAVCHYQLFNPQQKKSTEATPLL